MSEKENVSATVDPEVAQYLDQPGRNRSETINEAVKAYMGAGGTERAMLQLRLNQLQSRLETKQSEVNSIKEQIGQVEERLSELTTEQKEDTVETWDMALSMLSYEENPISNTVYIDSPDSAVEDFADRLDMSVEDFREEATRRYKEQ